MFDPQEQTHGEITSRRNKSDHWTDRMPGEDPERDEPASPLDSPEADARHKRLIGHYHRELERQADQRMLMERDEEFYDHEQWSEEELAELERRGQAPLQFNVIHTTVNWILGTQRSQPTDYRILPRRKEGTQQAQRKSEILKYLADVNDSNLHTARSFQDSVKVGVGWLECGSQADDDGEPVYDRHESWRNIIWDSSAQEWDLSDGRYLFRTKWTDVDTAKAMFASRKGLIEMSADHVHSFAGGVFDTSGDSAMDSAEEETSGLLWGSPHEYSERPRVRLIECWYRVPEEERFMSGGDFRGEIYDPWSAGHQAEIASGRANIVSRVKMRMRVAIMTTKGLLYDGPSPYRHNRYPLTPIWGYRRGRDGMPYGVIRGLIGPQQDLNKRASKSLHILSSAKVFMEEGAADVEVVRDEAARPDAVIEYKAGKAPPIIQTDTNLAAAHNDMMSRDIQMIQQVSGVTDENMGRTTNATSGKAIVARQNQGQLSTSAFFHNLTYARRIHGQKYLVVVEQFMSEERQFRITNSRGNPDYVQVNDVDENSITRTKADYVITEDDQRATIRQAQAESLLELLSQLAGTAPQIVVQMLDLLIEAMDVPQADEMVKRIRQMTGMLDPDADTENPDEDTARIMAAKEAQQEKQQRMEDAEVSEKEGKAQESQAKARKIMAEVLSHQGDQATQRQMDILKSAMEAAVEAVGAQQVAGVADQLLAEATRRAAMQAEPNQPAPEQQPALPAPDQTTPPQGAMT